MRTVRSWLAPIIISALLAGFIMLWENPPAALLPAALLGEQPPKIKTALATTILVNSTHREFDNGGTLKSQFHAGQSSRFQVDPNHESAADYSQLLDPTLVLYQAEGNPWNLVARAARVSDASDSVELMDSVRIWRTNEQGDDDELTSQYMVVKPEQQFVETDKPVTIRSTNEVTHAVGMRAFLDRRTFQLLSEVRGVYEPE